jgi:hypothetical protein
MRDPVAAISVFEKFSRVIPVLTIVLSWAFIMSSDLAYGQGDPEPDFQSRGVSQNHADELRNNILDAARRVTQAGSVSERVRWQEELCKRLIQAEDYVHALHVAHAIFQTDGAEPERRATHHFMMARIYRMMMDSAPDLVAMNDSRELAMKTVNEVLQRRYPANWGIGAAATQLRNELNDPRRIATAELAATRRSQGGLDHRQAAAAKAQTQAMEAAMAGRGGRPMATTPRSGPIDVDTTMDRDRITNSPAARGTLRQFPLSDSETRAEILASLRSSRGSGQTANAGVPGMVGSRMNASPERNNIGGDDFPEFGSSGGRSLGAAPIPGRGGVRGGSASGFQDRVPLSTEEQARLSPTRMESNNQSMDRPVQAALRARGFQNDNDSGYIPGGINRVPSIRDGSTNSRMPGNVRANAPAEAAGFSRNSPTQTTDARPFVTTSGRSPSSQRSGLRRSSSTGNSTFQNGARVEWSDQSGIGGNSSGSRGTQRFDGPVVIDSRTGRPVSTSQQRR